MMVVLLVWEVVDVSEPWAGLVVDSWVGKRRKEEEGGRGGEGGTYTTGICGGGHFGCQGPGGADGWSFGAAVCPDVDLFVSGAGGAVPVAAGVVRHGNLGVGCCIVRWTIVVGLSGLDRGSKLVTGDRE